MPYADAAASVAVTGAVAFGGQATAPGVIPLRIGGMSIATAVAAGDNATATAAKVLATIQGTPSLPVTATGNTGTLALTAANKGRLGNTIPISLAYYGPRGGEVMPPGLTCNITPMSGGAEIPISPAWPLPSQRWSSTSSSRPGRHRPSSRRPRP